MSEGDGVLFYHSSCEVPGVAGIAEVATVVLLVPGALVLRALGWLPRAPLALAGSFACSLAVCSFAFALTFAADGSLSLTIAIVGAISGGALVAAVRATPDAAAARDRPHMTALVAGGLALTAAVWWAGSELRGAELFDAGRVRRLEELPVLFSNRAAGELVFGSEHPGHGFPLWHGVLALVARLAGVGADSVVQHLGALLVPLTLLLAYAAGVALFGSRSGGVATALGQLAVAVGTAGGLGQLERLAQPHVAARSLILPALLALVLGWVRSGRRIELASVVACGFALAAVHGALAVLVGVPLAGVAVVRLAGGETGRTDARRTAVALVAALGPAALVAAWLSPLLWETNAFVPTGTQEELAVAASGGDLYEAGPFLGLHPSAALVGGTGAAVALGAALLALTRVRARDGAFVVGGVAAVFVVLLCPPFFTAAAELVSLPQARRLFLLAPLPFAIALACLVLGRAVRGRVREPVGALAVAAAFTLPFLGLGLAGLERDRPDPRRLPAELVGVVREIVPSRAVVFADLESSYRLAAATTVLVPAVPPRYVGRTESNDAYGRRRDVIAFFWRDGLSYLEHAAILRRYAASWLLVDRRRGVPEYAELLGAPAYDDGTYVLYRLRRP
jgi:hypothetical protein